MIVRLAAKAPKLTRQIFAGLAVHGLAMPTTHISRPARIWGLARSVAAFLNLWRLGYFAPEVGAGRIMRMLMPVVLVVAWFLPRPF